MILQILVNSTYEEERALVEVDSKKVILKGDYYHDKIDEKIEGFLEGLTYAKFEYTKYATQYIHPNQEIFSICDFIDESEIDEEYEED